MIDSAWRFDEIEDPYELMNAITLFQDKTGYAPTFPFQVSRKIFDSTQKGQFDLLTDDPDEYWQPFIENTRSEIIWLREPTEAESRGRFVYAYDKRMMFLSAARSASFGEGEYSIEENVFYDPKDKKTVGLAQIERPDFFKNEFTDFLLSMFADDEWFNLQYLSVFQEFCKTPIKIKKLYYWNNPSKIFEKFAVTIGTAVKETRGSDVDSVRSCNMALKALYTNFFGWFGRGIRPIPKYGAELFRPDWRGMIVSMAIVNLLRNILEVYRKTQKLPFAVDHDCLMYFADTDLEFDGTCLNDPNKFSVEWTLPRAAVLNAIAAGDATATAIDRLGKESEAERSSQKTVGADLEVANV
jgi:hypothetical protein